MNNVNSPASRIGAVSPNSVLSNLSMRLKQKFCTNTATLNTPSRISDRPFLFKTYDSNKEIWEIEEDFNELRRAEREYKRKIIPFLNIKKLNMENRENLIWKIKKIWDTFELSDDTFYHSVLLNDFQSMISETPKTDFKPKKLEELFDFSKVSDGSEKLKRYNSFFKWVAWIIISIKFWEHEKETPLTKEILEFFELER